MSNQKPWTLLQVGDKVVFNSQEAGQDSFTIAEVTGDKYLGKWDSHWDSTNSRSAHLIHTHAGHPDSEPPWWSRVARVDPAVKKPWAELRVGDRVVFPDSHFTVNACIHGGYSGNWHNPTATTQLLYEGDGEPVWWSQKLRIDPAPTTPWYRQLAVGDTFRDSVNVVYTVAVAGKREVEVVYKGLDGRTRRGTFPLFDSWISDSATPLSVAALQTTPKPPASHWSRNLKVGDKILKHNVTWTVEAIQDDGETLYVSIPQHGEAVHPIRNASWFKDAQLLPQPTPMPAPTPYPRHHVPTIPLEDLAVGEAVDVPVARYSKAMISDIVATYGKRASEGGQKERRIFGLVSTETTHTIWREM